MKLTKQLKITSFRDTLLKECSNKFHLKECRELLDTNLDLLGFTNGVYDLENGIFREGRPSDFISLSTNLEYNDYTHNSPEILELKKLSDKFYLFPLFVNIFYKSYLLVYPVNNILKNSLY